MKFLLALLPAFGLFIATTAPANAGPPMPPDLANLVAKLMPSVVSIASTGPMGDDSNQNSDPDTTPDQTQPSKTADTTGGTPANTPPDSVIPPPKASEALGSGFVIDPAGYIVTNNHVIDGATNVTVTFQDGTILPADIVGRDKDGDLAVLKVDAGHPLPAVSFGDSNKLRVGDWVLAIGNPFGLAGTTTAGIVSALHRNIGENKFDDFIQTDAAVNRGNSGGPLFDVTGHVIGVTSAIYSPSGGSIGLGFAIPAAMVQPVAASLKGGGSVTRGWLGIATENVTPQIETLLGLPNAQGALIGGTAPGGPAAGKLHAGDVLTSLNGAAISDPRSLLIRAAEIPVGQTAHAQFWRDGAEQSADLTVAAPPPNPVPGTVAPEAAANIILSSIGMAVAATSAQDGAHVLSVTAGGPAAKAGIVAADVVQAVGPTTVNSAADLKEALEKLATTHQPTAALLVAGDTAAGDDPGPRWIAVVGQ